MNEKPKRGFALLSPEQRKAISSIGGKSAIQRHKFDSEKASKAGKIGGKSKHPNKGFGSTKRKEQNNG